MCENQQKMHNYAHICAQIISIFQYSKLTHTNISQKTTKNERKIMRVVYDVRTLW